MVLYFLILIFNGVIAPDVEKVFGGRYAKDGEFPFVVSIQGEKTCAGSLVTLAKVVTAAHCLFIVKQQSRKVDNNRFYVVGGSVDIEDFNVGVEIREVREVNSVLLSGKYKPRSRFNGQLDSHDIGLAILDYPFYSKKSLQVMNLVSWDATVFKNNWDEIVAKKTICYAMGWGTTTYHTSSIGTDAVASKPSSILKVIPVLPEKNESCSMLFPRKEDMTMYGEICVYSVHKHETICDGDSGGPLVCDGRPYALLNYGPRCGTTVSPQVLCVALASEYEKVFGGRYAKVGEFPYVVSISGKMICAGSLVTLAKVVTAGHCLRVIEQNWNDITDVHVVGGTVNLKNVNEGFEERQINSVLLSGEYRPGSRFGGKIDSHDIGLAILDYPFYPGKGLQAMNLVSWNAAEFKRSWDEIVAKKTICYAMGWGMTAYRQNSIRTDIVASKPSHILKVIQVIPSDNESCSKLFPREEDMTMYGEICVYSVKHSETICDGDSGGPLVCDGRPYALLNHGPRCGIAWYPQGYLLYWNYLDLLMLNGARLVIPKWLFLLSFFLLSN